MDKQDKKTGWAKAGRTKLAGK